jgi:HAD superfamily hydrolase (TIGR01484 family)
MLVGDMPLLVATDLDGTIVHGDGTISERTVAAFARVEAAGARFVLVTGRPPRVMQEIADIFGRRGTASCANGALAYDMSDGTIETRHLISPAALAAAAAALRAAVPGIGIAVEYPDGHAADVGYQALRWDNKSLPRRPDEELFARPASKLLGRHFEYGCDDLLALARPALEGLVTVTHSSSTGLIEAAALGVTKGSVVAEIAAKHGVSREAVLAFGDMPNDLPMLTWAGVSCAVANAHPDVLAAVTHVIGSVDADGVAEYLEKVFP